MASKAFVPFLSLQHSHSEEQNLLDLLPLKPRTLENRSQRRQSKSFGVSRFFTLSRCLLWASLFHTLTRI
jgi:hypothetical protein